MKPARTTPVLRRLLLGVLIVCVARERVWMPLWLVGPSMEPTLLDGQFAGVNRLAYLVHPPQRGDIVVVQTGRGLIVKRIIGLPGEEVGIRDGVFQVNGCPVSEPHVAVGHAGTTAPAMLEADHYLIAGDNRAESLIALVHRRRIMGRLMAGPSALGLEGAHPSELRPVPASGGVPIPLRR